jgi:hypothetical protein
MSALPLLASAISAPISLPQVIPFALLLALNAIMPLTPPKVHHLWEHY